LPPRDTKQSDKLQAREEEDIQRGRELRERSSDAGAEAASDTGRTPDREPRNPRDQSP